MATSRAVAAVKRARVVEAISGSDVLVSVGT